MKAYKIFLLAIGFGFLPLLASGGMDMEMFQMDNDGGGTGVPIDGGLTTVIVGGAIYGYKKVKQYIKQNDGSKEES